MTDSKALTLEAELFRWLLSDNTWTPRAARIGAETLEEEHRAEVDHPGDPPQARGSPHRDLKRRVHLGRGQPVSDDRRETEQAQ